MLDTISNFFKSVFNSDNANCAGDCDDYNDDRDPYCVIGKTYYTHLRRYEVRAEPSNHGGATLAWRVFKDDDYYSIEYTWSECNLKEKDQFCKKTGRTLCDDRLADRDVKLPMLELSDFHPTVHATRDFVIDEFLRYKQRYQPNVWEEYL